MNTPSSPNRTLSNGRNPHRGAASPMAPERTSSSFGAEEDQFLEDLRHAVEGSSEQFVQQYAEVVFSAAWRLLRHEQEALDISQEALVEALRSMHEHHGDCDLSAWLGRIAAGVALKRLQWASGQPEVDIQHLLPSFDEQGRHAQTPKPWPAGAEAALLRGEREAQIRRRLEALPLQYRAVLVLRDLEKLSTAETAKALGISEAVVRVRLNQARLAAVKLLG